jgi:hypothetical protein
MIGVHHSEFVDTIVATAPSIGQDGAHRTLTFYWQHLLDEGVVASGSEIAQREGLHHSTVNELLRLTLLEPAIIQAILAGQQPRCMSLLWFQRNPLPTDWVAQRAVVAGV